MTIDKNKLNHAREWADQHRNISDHWLNSGVKAAAEVIQSLPAHWIDADKVREWMDEFIQRGRTGTPHNWLADAFTELQALLPAPTPQVEIALGAWAMHPEHGKVLILSNKADTDGDALVAREHQESSLGTVTEWVHVTDLSPVPSATPTEQDAPTPGTSPGGILHHPSSDHSADPNPGEAWLVDHKSKYMIRRDAGWVGELGYYSDEFANIAPLRRLVPAEEPGEQA